MPAPGFRPWRKPLYAPTGYALFFLAVATVLLGIAGYARLPEKALLDELKISSAPGTFARALDLFYLSLRLLWLGGPTTYSEPFLMVARWLGAAWAFGAIVRLLTPRIESVWRRWGIRARPGHSVVVGVGDRGAAFVRDLSKRGAVVAVSPEPEEKALALVGKTDRAVWMIEGDARGERALKEANVGRAARAILVTGSDTLNLEIARATVQFAARRGVSVPPLDLLVHVRSPALRPHVLADASEVVRFRQFSLPLLAARRLGWQHPAMPMARFCGRRRAHLLFVGFDDYAEELLLYLVRLGPLARQPPPRVTLLAPGAKALLERLARSYPTLAERTAGGLSGFDLDWSLPPTADELVRIEADEQGERVSSVIVTPPDDATGIAFVGQLRRVGRQIGALRVPFFVRVDRSAPFGPLFAASARTKRWSEALFPFGELDALCALESVDEWYERAAEALHEAYLQEIKRPQYQGRPLPAARPWNEITEELRDSNRRAVDHLGIKLASLGYVVRGFPPRLPARLLQTEAEIDALARLEHASWSAEKWLAGWHYAPVRDDARRVHDLLVPYGDLARERQKDVSQVKKITEWLHAAPGKGAGSVFRERTIGVVAASDLDLAGVERAAGGLLRILDGASVSERLGASGAEFWTVIVPVANESDVALARLVAGALHERVPGGRASCRYRIVVLCDLTASLKSAFQQQAGAGLATLDEAVDAFAGEEAACEWILDAATVFGRAALAPEEGEPGTRLAEGYLKARCSDLVVLSARDGLGAAWANRLEQSWPERGFLGEPFAPAPLAGSGLYRVS